MRHFRAGILSLLLLGLPASLSAGVLLDPKPAPEWKVSKWLNGDPGPLASWKGRIVLIDFFQLWCPGCQQFSVPLFNHWQDKYGANENVVIVSIHTVFEGHDVQTEDKLREFIADNGIEHPVGLDAYGSPSDDYPITMKRFDTEGTPHVVIIDRNGDLSFSHFGFFAYQPVEAFIDRLLKEAKANTFRATERKPAASKKKDTDKRRSGRNSRKPADKKATRKPPSRPDPKLSGAYTMQFEQTRKSCGDILQPLEVRVDLAVSGDQVKARFSKDFMGIRELKLSYDPDSGRVNAQDSRQVKLADAQVDLELDVDGTLIAGEQPEFEFEARLTKSGEDPSADCEVEARGRGTPVGKP